MKNLQPRPIHRDQITATALVCTAALCLCGVTQFATAQSPPAASAATPVRQPQKVPVKPTAKAAPTVPPPGATTAAVPDAIPLPVVNRVMCATTALAFSPDGSRLAVGLYGLVALYNTSTWEQVALCRRVQDSVRSVAFSPDGHTVAIGSGLPGRSGLTTLWDTTGGLPLILRAEDDSIECVTFAQDGKQLLIGSADNKARIYPQLAASAGTVLDEHNGRVLAAAFSPTQHDLFITGSMDKVVKVWNAIDNHTVVNFDQAQDGVTGLAFLNNGSQFVGSSLDGNLHWWGINRGKKGEFSGYQFRDQHVDDSGITCMQMSADGHRLIAGCTNGDVSIWDVERGNQTKRTHMADSPVYAAALNRDGTLAATAGFDGFVRIWDVNAGKVTRYLVPPAPAVKPAPAPHAVQPQMPVHNQISAPHRPTSRKKK